jgi:hypothetical protein
MKPSQIASLHCKFILKIFFLNILNKVWLRTFRIKIAVTFSIFELFV